jgi:hypothetical protein
MIASLATEEDAPAARPAEKYGASSIASVEPVQLEDEDDDPIAAGADLLRRSRVAARSFPRSDLGSPRRSYVAPVAPESGPRIARLRVGP